MVFLSSMYGFVEFKTVANICMGNKKNPLPNGINSDFKKPKKKKNDLLLFWCFGYILVFYTESYSTLMIA